MSKSILVLEVSREGYAVDQIRNTVTVGELISVLEQYDDDTPIYVSHDNGYTYGGVHTQWLDERWIEDEKDMRDEDEDPDAIYN